MKNWNLIFKGILIVIAIIFLFTAIMELVTMASTLMNIIGLGLGLFTGWFIGKILINFFNKNGKS